MKNNDWNARFGEKQRVIDKAILAEVERSIRKEEISSVPDAINPMPPTDFNDMRKAIAHAFGRPLTLPRPKIRDEAGQDANRVLPLALDSLVPPGWRSLAAKRGRRKEMIPGSLNSDPGAS